MIASDAGQNASSRLQASLDSQSTDMIGSYFDQARQAVVLVVDASRFPSALLRNAIDEAGKILPIVVRVSCRTNDDLRRDRSDLDRHMTDPADNVRRAIDRLPDRLKRLTIQLDYPRARYVVSVPNGAGTVAAVISESMAGRVDVRSDIEVGPGSRTSDASPHYGGARIQFQNAYTAGGCSTSFPIVSGGHWYMATAYHCGFGYSTTTFASGPNSYGVQGPAASGYDTTLIGSSSQTYARLIYADPCCPAVREITGSISPWVGQSVCTNGSYTTMRCGVTVNSLHSATVCGPAPWGLWCTLAINRANRPGVLIFQQGDSGGGLVQRSTSTCCAFAVGVQSGADYNLSSSTADNVAFAGINDVLATLGGSVPSSGGPGN